MSKSPSPDVTVWSRSDWSGHLTVSPGSTRRSFGVTSEVLMAMSAGSAGGGVLWPVVLGTRRDRGGERSSEYHEDPLHRFVTR